MAKIYEPISDAELKKSTVVNLRNEYKKLSNFYQRIINNELIYCSHCGQWKPAATFYASDASPDGIEHYACKECLLNEMTDYDKKSNIRTDNREKTINTFRRLDWYFNEKTYNEQLQLLSEQTGEKIRSTAVQQWIVMLKSLPNWKGLTWKDSEFLDDDESTLQLENKRKPRKEIIKLFGSGFSVEDYLYLQDQYDDWKERTEVNSKSQQTYIVQICFKQLEIWKAQKIGKDTDKLVKSLNDLMNGANLQPRQNVGNAATDSLTFGQLIEKWELEKPIPTPSDEFQDCDNIGKYLRVFFTGWLAKAVGLKNSLSQECEEYMEQYTVKKPEYQEEGNSNDIYTSLFGNDGE